MKTQAINFFYKGAKDSLIKARQVFIMNASEDHIQGFDFGELSPSERKIIRKTFKNRDVLNRFATKENPAHTSDSNEIIETLIKKSWKSFKKENIKLSVSILNTREDLFETMEKLGTRKAVVRGIERAFKSGFYKNFKIVKSLNRAYEVSLYRI